MPLPPRDMSALHLSLNPALAEMHDLFHMSRYLPVVAIMKLWKLAQQDGVPIMSLLDTPSWMTMACLDDVGADHCISQAVAAMANARMAHAAVLNATLACYAAPFLLPVMMPATMLSPPGSFSDLRRSTVSPAESVATPASAASAAAPEPRTTPSAASAAGGEVVAVHASVQRCMDALVREFGRKMRCGDRERAHLATMPPDDACAVLHRVARRMRTGVTPGVARGSLLEAVASETVHAA